MHVPISICRLTLLRTAFSMISFGHLHLILEWLPIIALLFIKLNRRNCNQLKSDQVVLIYRFLRNRVAHAKQFPMRINAPFDLSDKVVTKRDQTTTKDHHPIQSTRHPINQDRLVLLVPMTLFTKRMRTCRKSPTFAANGGQIQSPSSTLTASSRELKKSFARIFRADKYDQPLLGFMVII